MPRRFFPQLAGVFGFVLTVALCSVAAEETLVSGALDEGFSFVDTYREEFILEQELGTVAEIRSMVLQQDGKILIGSSAAETELGYPRYPLRLFPDGSIDPSFAVAPSPESPYQIDEYYEILAVDSEGRVLVGIGSGGLIASPARELRLVRRMPDGSPDGGFLPPTNAIGVAALREDGRIYAQLVDEERFRVVRLLENGGLDMDFDADDAFPDEAAIVMKVAPDGGVYVASERFVARILPDGTPMPGYAREMLQVEIPFGETTVRDIELQSDGKLLVAHPYRVARHLPDGSHDPEWMIGGPDGTAPADLRDLALDSSERVLVAGLFWNYNFEPRDGLVRLLQDGSVDPYIVFPVPRDPFWWEAVPSAPVNKVEVQRDGKIVAIGGSSIDKPVRSSARNMRSLDWLPSREMIGGVSNRYLLTLDARGRITDRIDLEPKTDTQGLAYREDTNTLLVTLPDPGGVFEYSLEGREIRFYDIGAGPIEGLEYASDTGRFLVAVSGETPAIYEYAPGHGGTEDVLGIVDLEPLLDLPDDAVIDPEGLAYDAGNRRLYVAFDQTDLVAVFDFTPAKPAPSPPVPTALSLVSMFETNELGLAGGPDGIARNPETGNLFLVNSEEGHIVETTPAGDKVRWVNPPYLITTPISHNIVRFYGDVYLNPERLLNPKVEEGRFNFEFSTEMYQRYLIEGSDVLHPGNWSIFLQEMNLEEGMVIFRDNREVKNMGQRFYRVRLASGYW